MYLTRAEDVSGATRSGNSTTNLVSGSELCLGCTDTAKYTGQFFRSGTGLTLHINFPISEPPHFVATSPTAPAAPSIKNGELINLLDMYHLNRTPINHWVLLIIFRYKCLEDRRSQIMDCRACREGASGIRGRTSSLLPMCNGQRRP